MANLASIIVVVFLVLCAVSPVNPLLLAAAWVAAHTHPTCAITRFGPDSREDGTMFVEGACPTLYPQPPEGGRETRVQR